MLRLSLDSHFCACVDVRDHDRLRIFPPTAECYQSIYKDYNLVTRYQVAGLTHVLLFIPKCLSDS